MTIFRASLVGKTIESYEPNDHIVFTDGSRVEFDTDYSDCYYEGDTPGIKCIYHPSKNEKAQGMKKHVL